MPPRSATSARYSTRLQPGAASLLDDMAVDSVPDAGASSDIVYRNPIPHVRAVHAWHPTLISLGGGRLLVTFDLGQAVESLDYRTYTSHSEDEGAQWTPPRAMIDDVHARASTHSVRSVRLADGSLIGVGARFFRDNPDEGICNRANMGLVPMELFLTRSADEGNSWTDPQTLAPPLVGPAFEVAHGVVELSDGRWLWPTSTWKGWDGVAPHGMKAIALVSYDRGSTWPEYVDTFDGVAAGIIHFEQSVVKLADGRLLACAWALDGKSGHTRDVVYSISVDGRKFTPPRTTELPGETSKLLPLLDGRALCFYRSLDQPGLGVAIVEIRGDQWRTTKRMMAWRGAATGLVGARSAADELAELRLGYPSSVLLPNGDALCAFWCRVDEVNEIRWVRVNVKDLEAGKIQA